MKFLIAIVYSVIGQAITFLILQGSYKYQFLKDNILIICLSGAITALLFYKSVHLMIEHFDGEAWPGRIIGFALGILVFSIMSILMFKEGITPKTLVCIALSMIILAIQLLWK